MTSKLALPREDDQFQCGREQSEQNGESERALPTKRLLLQKGLPPKRLGETGGEGGIRFHEIASLWRNPAKRQTPSDNTVREPGMEATCARKGPDDRGRPSRARKM
jgi:hypothetical protein